MSAQIIPFVIPVTLESAWERYRKHAVRAQEEPRLARDEGFRDRHTYFWQQFIDLYLEDSSK